MPRVHFVKAARKDNPAVKKGESYYHWKFRYGGKHYSRTRPKPSQLTQSDKLSRIYEAQEMLSEVCFPTEVGDMDRDQLVAMMDTVRSAYEDAAEAFREVSEEYNESADNKEEYFPGTGDEIREKADACEEAASEADDAASEWDSAINDIEAIDIPEPKEESSEDEDEDEEEDEVDPDEWKSEADDILGNLTNEVIEVNL